MSARRARQRRSAPAPAVDSAPPPVFAERMAALLEADAAAFFAALHSPAAGLRVNTLRLDPQRLRAIVPFELEPLTFPPEGFLVPEEAGAGRHPYHAAGLYYLQDPGAMVVGAVPDLPAEPRVLDLAAAPGGKATHLAARMRGRGVLVANDVHAGRARELAGNLERCGVANAIVTCDSAERLAMRWPEWFDAVLLDAPCSGESMFHKSAAARAAWSPEAVSGCARRQEGLLEQAAALVRPGGTLLYSTCTFSPEENEGVIEAFLRQHDGWSVEPRSEVAGAEAGRPDWVVPPADASLAGTLRLWPHRLPGAGHFVAALRRSADSPEHDRPASDAPANPRQSAEASTVEAPLEPLRSFLAETIPGCVLPAGEIVGRGEELFLRPAGAPPLERVRVVRPGLWLGAARKGRFEPSHALAMTIEPGSVARRLDVAADSSEAEGFLAGETLREEGPEGWLLVTVDGFALGWGKRTGPMVKNHYPKGLRRR